ncbi:MAG: hypothetical protein GC165_13865 [Armatimonadetes bacterium]|nr:hypothetical protein [Armatimonadota bacterium]
MKSDRRTLTILAVVVVCSVVVASFRSAMLMGVRLLMGQASLARMDIVSTTDRTNPINLGAWTLPDPDGPSDAGRDSQLGAILVQTMNKWNQESEAGRIPTSALEKYVQDHPDDLKAKAHLMRISLSLTSLKGVRDKNLLKEQAQKLAKLAGEVAAKEPDNWYWREREFHFLTLAGDNGIAEEALTAQPFPTKYEDYVDDEVRCREATFRSSYMDFPSGLVLPIWAGVTYPHYAAASGISKDVAEAKNPLSVRVAEMSLGDAMIHSCPTPIAALVGVRVLRHGLWNSSKPYGDWRKLVNESEAAKVKGTFLKSGSAADWNHSLEIAKKDITLHFYAGEDNPREMYVAQFGPIMVGTGLLSLLVAVPAWFWSRAKGKNLGNRWLAWTILVGGLMISMLCWHDWGYMANYSLGSRYLEFPFTLTWIWATIATLRREKGSDRLVGVILLGCIFACGWLTNQTMAATFLFLILYVSQKGQMPLGPWASSVGLVLFAFHAVENLAFWHGDLFLPLGFILGGGTLLLVSQRSLEPDQPRWSGLTTGVALLIVGSIFMAQYNRGASAMMARELERTNDIRKQFASF